MAKKPKKKYSARIDDFDDVPKGSRLREDTVKLIYAILFFIAALFLVFSGIGENGRAGFMGAITKESLGYLFGIGYFLLPLLLCTLGIVFLSSLKQSVAWPKLLGSFLFLVSGLGIISLNLKDIDGVGRGGLIGNLVATPLNNLFEFWVSLIFLLGLLLISILVIADPHLSVERILGWFRRKEGDEFEEIDPMVVEPESARAAEMKLAKEALGDTGYEAEEKKDTKKIIGAEKSAPKEEFSLNPIRFLGKPFVPPPLSLLNEDKGKPGVGDIKANANTIKRTLQHFGINVEMDEISIGPSVTRYALKPAEGVKLSRIVGLQNDLALALAAHPIRIEAPIPGKSLVGIEIPNSTKTTVGLGTILGSEEFQHSDKNLLVGLGRGVSGKMHYANLAKMPHLLIAGATGSGKSVTIHALLTSLLYRNSPENLKFIMIDPKRVELTMYNKIPHLLTPVITEAKKAILALKWAGKEMDRRYDILEAEKVRDIESYHKTILAPALKKLGGKEAPENELVPEMMPYIIIVIDELADLMQMYPRELESAVVRLAQMSRAVGIHLILSTQRPSVNVITGLIKANIPSRIALQVTSQIDSRTILDTGGAEKLLGAGDMLFMSGDMSKPSRIQSAYISELELKNVVKYLVDTYADELPSEINLTESAMDKNSIFESSFDDDAPEDDALYEEAKEIVIQAGKASTSYLQRKLGIGYARAARIIDALEERGVIGHGDGAKPREVIDSGASVTPPETTEEHP